MDNLYIDTSSLREIQELACRSQESENLLKTLETLNPIEKKALLEMMKAIERGDNNVTVEDLSGKELKELKQKLDPNEKSDTVASGGNNPQFSSERLKQFTQPVADMGNAPKSAIKSLTDLFQRDMKSSPEEKDTGISAELLMQQIEKTKRVVRKRKS